MPTVSGTATRAVDDMHCTLNSIPYSATTMSFYADHKRRLANAGYGGLYPRWVGFGDAADGFGLVSDIDTTFTIGTELTTATIELAGPVVFAVDPGTNVRIQSSVAMQSNNMAGSGNGAAVNIENGSALGDCNTGGTGSLQLGGPSTRPLIGYLYRFVAVPRRVIDANCPLGDTITHDYLVHSLTDTPARLSNQLLARGIIEQIHRYNANRGARTARGHSPRCRVDRGAEPHRGDASGGRTERSPDGTPNPDYVPAVMDQRRAYLVKVCMDAEDNETDGLAAG